MGINLLVNLLTASLANAITLIISLVIAYWLLGELELGPVKTLLIKIALLSLAATAVSMAPLGIWFTVIVWLFGIMAFLRLPFKEAWPLAIINWFMSYVIHYGVMTLTHLIVGSES
jgi:hypothetical protein